LKKEKLIRALKETVHPLNSPANAQRLFDAFKQKSVQMTIKEFLTRKWVGNPNTTTKE